MRVFANAKIIPVEGDIIEKGSIVIEEGKIVEIGNIDLSKFPKSEIMDCEGKWITPGLIDAHSHVGLFEQGSGPGPAYSDGNEMTDPITPHVRALDAIFPEDLGFDDARRGGVTTMGLTPGSGNLIGGQFVAVKSIGIIVDEMVIKKNVGLKMALGENPKRVYNGQKRMPSTRMGNAAMIRQAFYNARDYIYEWKQFELAIEQNTDGKPLKRPKFDMKMEILGQVLDKKLPMRLHAHRADDIVTAKRIADEFDLNLIIEHATEGHKIADFIVENEIPVIVGPLISNRSKLELRDRTITTPGILVKAGAEVSITTDSPVLSINYLRESMIFAVRAGLPIKSALNTITINPARILGVDDRVGSLVVGKDADFVIFNNDPLDARSIAEYTFIDGELVYQSPIM